MKEKIIFDPRECDMAQLPETGFLEPHMTPDGHPKLPVILQMERVRQELREIIERRKSGNNKTISPK